MVYRNKNVTPKFEKEMQLGEEEEDVNYNWLFRLFQNVEVKRRQLPLAVCKKKCCSHIFNNKHICKSSQMYRVDARVQVCIK
jgi:hypothetical protein